MSVPKCAFSFPSPDGKPGPCKSGKPAGFTLTVALEDGNELSGSRSEARLTCCQDCGMSMYGPALQACSAQARGNK